MRDAKKTTAKKATTRKPTAKKAVAKKTTAKKATTRKPAAKKRVTTKAVTRKTTTRARLKRQDLRAIAKLAKLSISTLVKWNDGSLPVKPDTELKIFKAIDQFSKEEVVRLEEHLQKLTEIENRISLQRTGLKQAIHEMRKIKIES